MNYCYFKDKNKNLFKDEYFSKGNIRSHFIKKQNYKMFLNQRYDVHKNILRYMDLFLKNN